MFAYKVSIFKLCLLDCIPQIETVALAITKSAFMGGTP